MKEITIITRPENLEKIKAILDNVNCGGMTLSTAMGCGTQKGMTPEDADAVNEIRGFHTKINLLPKIKIEAMVKDDDVEPVIAQVREQCATGHVGDGKIFISEIVDAIRIRTGERGEKALS